MIGYLLIIIGAIAGIWIFGSVIKKVVKFVFIILSWLFMLVVIAFGIVWFLDINFEGMVPKVDPNYTEDEIVAIEEDENLPQNTNYIFNTLRWTDYNNKKYTIKYRIGQTDFREARQNRMNCVGYTWGEIYGNLYQNDSRMLSDLYQKYDSISHGHSSLEFARLVVSSIQEVPYTWILIDNCQDAPNWAEIKKSGNECLGNIRNYAVQSPVEFVANLKGDCDTKALLLYAILKRFNYDVCVLVSEQYGHAMLGINIPASGSYVRSGGVKYYVWETTVKGYDIGQAPAEYSNMSLWDVAL
jgi:hypothetical protein